MSKKTYRVNNQEVAVKATNAVYNGDISGVDNAQDAIDNLNERLEVIEQGKANPDTGRVSVRLLCVGNSLLQDAVSYLPLVLNEFRDYIDYKIYLWYRAGHTLLANYNKITGGYVADIFSVCENDVTWTNYNSSKAMPAILDDYSFDTLVLQEYFNSFSSVEGYTSEMKSKYDSLVNWFKANQSGDFRVYSYWEAPIRGGEVTTEQSRAKFDIAKSCLEWQLKNTSCEDIIPSGIAALRAMDVASINELGASGYGSADSTHSQEGLPCLMLAWTFGQWLMNKLGLPFSISQSQVRMTSAIHNTLDVPGRNGSLIIGTEEQNQAARDVAFQAVTEGRYIVNTMLNS